MSDYSFKQAIKVLKDNDAEFLASAWFGNFDLVVYEPLPQGVKDQLFAILGEKPLTGESHYEWHIDELCPVGFYAPRVAIVERDHFKGNFSVFLKNGKWEFVFSHAKDSWLDYLEKLFGRRPERIVVQDYTYYESYVYSDLTPDELYEIRLADDDYCLGKDTKFYKEIK